MQAGGAVGRSGPGTFSLGGSFDGERSQEQALVGQHLQPGQDGHLQVAGAALGAVQTLSCCAQRSEAGRQTAWGIDKAVLSCRIRWTHREDAASTNVECGWLDVLEGSHTHEACWNAHQLPQDAPSSPSAGWHTSHWKPCSKCKRSKTQSAHAGSGICLGKIMERHILTWSAGGVHLGERGQR